MSDLISRQAVIDALVKRMNCDWDSLKILQPALKVIEQVPSAYPKKGKWFYQDTMYSCDQCHGQFYDMSPFCPCCGADMRGEE